VERSEKIGPRTPVLTMEMRISEDARNTESKDRRSRQNRIAANLRNIGIYLPYNMSLLIRLAGLDPATPFSLLAQMETESHIQMKQQYLSLVSRDTTRGHATLCTATSSVWSCLGKAALVLSDRIFSPSSLSDSTYCTPRPDPDGEMPRPHFTVC
jgi:hypothetical protein